MQQKKTGTRPAPPKKTDNMVDADTVTPQTSSTRAARPAPPKKTDNPVDADTVDADTVTQQTSSTRAARPAPLKKTAPKTASRGKTVARPAPLKKAAPKTVSRGKTVAGPATKPAPVIRRVTRSMKTVGNDVFHDAANRPPVTRRPAMRSLNEISGNGTNSTSPPLTQSKNSKGKSRNSRNKAKRNAQARKKAKGSKSGGAKEAGKEISRACFGKATFQAFGGEFLSLDEFLETVENIKEERKITGDAELSVINEALDKKTPYQLEIVPGACSGRLINFFSLPPEVSLASSADSCSSFETASLNYMILVCLSLCRIPMFLIGSSP